MINVTRIKQRLQNYLKHVNISSTASLTKVKMKKEIQKFLEKSRRAFALIAAIVFATLGAPAIALAANNPQGGQVQTRSIRMSDNAASGGTITTGVGSGTNVTYRVVFKAATSYTLKGVVLDFCAGTGGTPFIGDGTCAAPSGFDVGTPTVSVADFTDASGSIDGLTTATPVTWDTSDSSAQTFVMTNTEGIALTANHTYTFAVSGITNPDISELGTFYGRLVTYDSATGDIATYTHSNPGTYQDFGGFALSTAKVVQVTAKVQETLTFCVSGYGTAGGAGVAPTNCGADATAPAIILGHGTNNTLDAGQVDTNSVWTYTSSNALNGVTIRMRNSNACGGLSTNGGTTCDIPAVGTAVPGAIAAGTAAFGMFCNNSTGGTGSMTCDGGYRDSSHVTAPSDVYYGMDTTTSAENVTTLYGDKIAASSGPLNNVLNQYDFAATASNTTPAGIYTASLAMIATGSF